MTQSIKMSNFIYFIIHVPPEVNRIQATKMEELGKVKVIPQYQINRKAVTLQRHDVKHLYNSFFSLMNSEREGLH